MQQKFRVSNDEWQQFCETLPEGHTPSDRLRELVAGTVSPLSHIMGVHEAAEAWGTTAGYVKNLCAEGKVNAVNIGKTWILDKNQPSPIKRA